MNLSSRSLECHAANDESFCFFTKNSRLAFLGLVQTVNLADTGIVFDGSECFVGQRHKFALNIRSQVFCDRLFRALEHLHSHDMSARVLDSETTE
jgi:hypothetical protein